MIKAVIFDMDGVLIDTEKYYIQLGMDITKEMGYEIPREVFLSMRSLNRKFSKPMLLEKYGEDFDFEYFHAERRKRLRAILESRGIEKKPGVDEVLSILKREGLQTAVATATDMERASSYLSQIGVLEKFDRILSVSNVKNGKPMPDVYLEACRQLEKEPSECIAVEGTVCLCGRAEGGYGAGFNAAGGRDSAIFVGCGTETSGGGRVRKDFIKFIYKSD